MRWKHLFLFSLVLVLLVSTFRVNPAFASPLFSPRTETYVNLASLTTPFDITVTKPTGTVNGDILFCWIGWYAAVTIDSVPSGWNLLGEYIVNTDRYALYYKIASGEGASWVWSFAATAKVRAVCSAYTGGDFNAADPIDVVSNTAYRTNDVNCRAASMSVASANSPLIFWGGVYSTASKTFTKPSVPTTDWVEDDDAGNTTPDFWTEVCSMIWSGSGDTGIMSATISASLAVKHAFAVALNPPAGQSYERVASQSITVAFVSAKQIAVLKAVSQSFGLGFGNQRAIEVTRLVTQSLTVSYAVTRASEFLRSTAQSLSFSWQGVGESVTTFLRDAALSLTVAFGVLRQIDIMRLVAQQLGLSLSTAHLIEIIRLASQQIGIGFSVARLLEALRLATQQVGLSLSVDRLAEFVRSAAQTISFSWESLGEVTKLFFAEASLSLTFALEVLRQIDVTRLATQQIGLNLIIARLIEVTRAVSQTLSLGFSALGSSAQEIMRQVGLALYFAFDDELFGLLFGFGATESTEEAAIIGALLAAIIVGAVCAGLIYTKRRQEE